jgi:hypothetical protein
VSIRHVLVSRLVMGGIEFSFEILFPLLNVKLSIEIV